MDNIRHKIPFLESHELCIDLPAPNHSTGTLPGYPNIPLDNAAALQRFLVKEHWAQDLERAWRHFWMLTSPSSANIRPLHKQRLLGREIFVAEEPGLHLTWMEGRVMIKPLPKYLLSHYFWTEYLLRDDSPLGEKTSELRKAALGFLRTYRYLIQHESDFRIAHEAHLQLVPAGVEWSKLILFLSDLAQIEDKQVSGRYRYGEMRLSRLNQYSFLLFGRMNYKYIPQQYGTYFARFYGPILFAFAVATTVLNSMQVTLTADDRYSGAPYWAWKIFFWFSIVSLLSTVAISVYLAAIWTQRVANEWYYASQNRHKIHADHSNLAHKELP